MKMRRQMKDKYQKSSPYPTKRATSEKSNVMHCLAAEKDNIG